MINKVKIILSTLIKLLVSVGLLFLVYSHLSSAKLLNELVSVKVWPVIICLIIFCLNTFISTIKWKMFLVKDGEQERLGTLFVSYLIGSFFNMFLPSNVGGDYYRIASTAGGRLSKSTASVLADRISGFVALSVICLVFSIVGYSKLEHHVYVVIPALLLLALILIVWMLIGQGMIMKMLSMTRLDKIPKLSGFIQKVMNSFANYNDSPMLLLKAVVLSFIFQFVVIFCIYFMAKAVIPFEIDLINFMIFVPIISLLESIPLTIFGIGFRDAGYVFFFYQIGLSDPEVHAAAISLLYVSLTAIYTSFGGLLYLMRALRKEKKPVD